MSAAMQRPGPDATLEEWDRWRASPLLDEHFRQTDLLARDAAQHGAALRMAAMSTVVAAEFRRLWPEAVGLPEHAGYRRLAIDAEKAQQYAKAIAWCEQAKVEGWSGDWDKRIARCERKIDR